MIPINSLLRTPSVAGLDEAPERAALSLLAAAASCSRNVLTLHHGRAFDAIIDAGDEDPCTPALSLVALQVTKSIDNLLRSLRLYDACLRDHLLAEHSDPDLPF